MEHVEAARQVMVRLQEVGISMKEVTQQLEEEGVQKFADPFDELMDTLTSARDQYRTAAQTVTS
jgi:transaldolase